MRCVFLALLSAALLLGASGASAATAYRVKPGDTLSGISARTGISVGTLRAANPRLARTTAVQAGWVLVIPARRLPPGTHTVTAGQNLTTIARKYGVSLSALVAANPTYRGGRDVWVGARLTIPARTRHGGGVTVRTAATPERPERPQAARTVPDPQGGEWLWPLRGYRSISSGFGGRELGGQDEVHYGVDIVAPLGTPVRAARSGRVLESRLDDERGWGWTVVIEHPDGWITRYAHLSANLIKTGELVVRGQVIGRVGDTGRSTGPHLHFGTYLRWVPRDPLSLY